MLAAVLVVTLSVDPASLGGAGLGLAQAAETVPDESREENFDAAVDALTLPEPEDAVPVTPPAVDGDEALTALELPTELPAEKTVPVALGEGAPESVAIDLGGMEVSVAPTDDGTSPTLMDVHVEDQAATANAGISGVLLDVVDTSPDPVEGDQSVELTVSYADFAGLSGGDWADRLHAVWYPACAVQTPDAAGCLPTLLPSTHEVVDQTVTVDVPVNDPEPAAVATAAVHTVTAAPGRTTGGSVAITAGVAGPMGNWGATSLAPSSTWATTGATGGFTWAYPMRVPHVPAGPAPELSVSYASQVSDGRIPSTNNQSGLLGEGFDLGASYIERSYTPCSEDETPGANNIGLSAPDLCWGKENATLSLNGAGLELIKDKSTSVWHPKRDDGTRIQYSASGGAAGEHWTVTTTDGTRYVFGQSAQAASAWTVPVFGNNPNEPGNAATFKASVQPQVWRWNLDQVIDPSGNTASYFYAKETNRYRPYYGGKASLEYVSGGHLTRIEYGTHPDDGVSNAPAKVELTYAPRCITNLSVPNSWCSDAQTSPKENHWSDTPVDLICTNDTDCATKNSPTFFDRVRLSKITTYAHDGSTFQPVDSWTLEQRFVAQGDGVELDAATGIMMRLDSIKHDGLGGTLADIKTLPATTFDYVALQNRIPFGGDDGNGATPSYRHRVSSVRTESGGRISVTYDTGCKGAGFSRPENTHDLCYPVKWHDPAEVEERTDYFNKWVVTSVVQGHTSRNEDGKELITGSLAVATTYDYTNANWEWVKPTTPLIDDGDKTYSEFRGAESIATLTGQGDDPITKTVTTYYRGLGVPLTLGGDISVPDTSERLVGQVFSETVYDGDGSETLGGTGKKITETVTEIGTPVIVATSALNPTFTSSRIATQTTHKYTYLKNGNVQFHTKTTNTFNEYSQPTTVDDLGDISIATDDTCTRTSYAHESSTALRDKHLVALPATVETVAKKCSATPARPADVISASKAVYDGAGRPTAAKVINPEPTTFDPQNDADYVSAGTVEYDTRGRATKTTDAQNNATTTAYTASAGGLLASTMTLKPLGHSTTTGFDPILGVPTASTDANGRVTTGKYDALGRLTEARYPQHPASAGFAPSVTYAYTVSETGLNAVVTKTIAADGKHQHTSSTLYDALLRPFQTQQEGKVRRADATAITRLVTFTKYDSAGRVIDQYEPWHSKGAPAAIPAEVPGDTGGHTTFVYDRAGRQTEQTFWQGASTKKWSTLTSYDGATTLQIPPLGATPTETIVDARGRTTTLTQYSRDPDIEAQASANTAKTVHEDLKSTATTYTYDSAGLLATMKDANTNTWTYGYDKSGRQITATDPDAGTSSTKYDLLGRVTTKRNGNEKVLAYTYDALGRTTSVRDDTVTGPVRASWTYDTLWKGVLYSAIRKDGSNLYENRIDDVDLAYRPLKTTVVLPATPAVTKLKVAAYSTSYTYTADGQTASTTYPAVAKADGTSILNQEKVTTGYNASSMPSWMGGGFGWGIYVASAKYNFDGKTLATDLGSTYGAAVTYKYDAITQRLSNINLDRAGISATEVDMSYTYDPAGNVTSLKDQPKNTALDTEALRDNQCFNYDGYSNLELAWTAKSGVCNQTPSASAMGGAAPYWTRYFYGTDEKGSILGNRTSQVTHTATGTATTTTYGYGADTAGPHAVTSSSTGSTPTTYTYDKAGNRISSGSGTPVVSTWDPEGELSTVGATAFIYDADGNRLTRTDTTGTTVYLGSQELLITPAGDVKATRYYNFADQTVAVRTGRGLGDQVTSLVNDAHGTPVAAIPNGGHPKTTAVKRFYTDPFGATRGASNAATVPGDNQFLGKTRDASTGLTLVDARYYDEVVGGFISADPLLDLRDPRQWNAYAYASNNPVSRSDPSGLAAIGGTDDVDVNGKTFKGTGGGTVQASPPQTVDPPVTPDPREGALEEYDEWSSAQEAGIHGYGEFAALWQSQNAPSTECMDPIACEAGALMLADIVYAITFGKVAGAVRSGGTAVVRTADGVVAVGLGADAASAAFQGMRAEGGHAIRHLREEGLIPNTGSLSSQVSKFEQATSPILTSPSATFDWRVGSTEAHAFAGKVGGRQVVVFVAAEGAYEGKVLSAYVPTSDQISKMGLK
ncbi:hypothetical protein ASF62_11090 [Leifsonia sp. Leaf325]|nr:hypothetical protein ASF62_11090 [Leifsonia sp. Leaf325]